MPKKIVVIPGDGIGREITESAVAVLQEIDKRYKLDLVFSYHDAGGTAYDKFGVPLPDETLAAAKAADAVLFGAVGGDKWDSLKPELRPERAILGLRKGLELYANLRPVKTMEALIDYSPLKPDIIRGTDILIVRELIGGIYFGEKCESEKYNGTERAWDLENYSIPEVERIVTLAMESARKRKGRVTSVDKANVLATSRLWRRTAASTAEKYPDIALDNMYVDNCSMQLAINPKHFDVIVTGNLFGDILSDEAAVLGGSIGLMPSASIGEKTSLFEPIHGSAPDIAGKGIANPLGTILSAAMLLRYSFDAEDAALAIENAVKTALDAGYRTADLFSEGFKKTDTVQMTQAVIDNIK